MGGVPGTGKSHWAKRYASEHGNTYIIDTDEVRKSITGDYRKFPDPQSISWDEMIRQANEIFATKDDVTVIIDSTFLDDERRMYYLNRLKGYDYLEHFLIKFHDYSVVYERNKARREDKWVPEDVIDKMVAKYQNPSPEVEKLFDRITIEYWN